MVGNLKDPFDSSWASLREELEIQLPDYTIAFRRDHIWRMVFEIWLKGDKTEADFRLIYSGMARGEHIVSAHFAKFDRAWESAIQG